MEVEKLQRESRVKQMILDRFGSEAKAARTLGWPRQRLNKITIGRKEPDLEEVSAISALLDVPVGEMVAIFLANSVTN